MSVNSYNSYIGQLIGEQELYDVTDKKKALADLIRYMLLRTQCMFEWTGLPDTIPAQQLELLLQVSGHACICEVGGKLYALTGGLGGEPDPYYQPTVYTVANPALNFSAQLKIGTDCVLIRNDVLYQGLIPMFRKYASFLVETELSLDMSNVNARQEFLIAAKDDRTKQAADLFLKNLRDGKPGAIGDSIQESLRTQPYASTGAHVLTDLIELNQYWRGTWMNEIGLNANWNAKRESLNSAESELNHDGLFPLVEELLQCRSLAAEAVAERFGVRLAVARSSAWRQNEQEVNLELEKLKVEANPEPEPEPEPEQKNGEDNNA